MFAAENVRSIRPGHGLAPKYLAAIMGRRAMRNIEKGTPLAWNLVDGVSIVDMKVAMVRSLVGS